MRNKRTLLLLVGTMVIAALASVSYAQFNWATSEDEARRPVGSWIINVVPVNPPMPAVVNFSALTSDGLLINSNETGSASIGVWTKTGSRQYSATFTGLQVMGSQTFRYKVRGTLELSRGGEALDGPFVNDIFYADGSLFLTVTGTVHAARMHVEPLP
jgi:hypothetical protein